MAVRSLTEPEEGVSGHQDKGAANGVGAGWRQGDHAREPGREMFAAIWAWGKSS